MWHVSALSALMSVVESEVARCYYSQPRCRLLFATYCAYISEANSSAADFALSTHKLQLRGAFPSLHLRDSVAKSSVSSEMNISKAFSVS